MTSSKMRQPGGRKTPCDGKGECSLCNRYDIATIGKVRDVVLPAVCQKGVVIVGRKVRRRRDR